MSHLFYHLNRLRDRLAVADEALRDVNQLLIGGGISSIKEVAFCYVKQHAPSVAPDLSEEVLSEGDTEIFFQKPPLCFFEHAGIGDKQALQKIQQHSPFENDVEMDFSIKRVVAYVFLGNDGETTISRHIDPPPIDNPLCIFNLLIDHKVEEVFYDGSFLVELRKVYIWPS